MQTQFLSPREGRKTNLLVLCDDVVFIMRITRNAYTVIPRLTKIIRSGITFVSRNLR